MQIKACSDAASSKRSLLNYCCHCSQELLCRPCTSFPSLSWVPHEPCQPIPPIAAGMLQTLGRRNVQRDESLVLATGTERTKCPGRQGPDTVNPMTSTPIIFPCHSRLEHLCTCSESIVCVSRCLIVVSSKASNQQF